MLHSEIAGRNKFAYFSNSNLFKLRRNQFENYSYLLKIYSKETKRAFEICQTPSLHVTNEKEQTMCFYINLILVVIFKKQYYKHSIHWYVLKAIYNLQLTKTKN